MNATIIQNLKVLLAAVEAQPESQFDLSFYKKEEVCGTLFCTIGLAASLPFFQNLGYKFVTYDGLGGTTVYFVHKGNEEITYTEATDEDFGPNSFEKLFAPAGTMSDVALGYEVKRDEEGDRIGVNFSDKELAIKRLETRISEYEAAQ